MTRSDDLLFPPSETTIEGVLEFAVAAAGANLGAGGPRK